MKMKCVDCLKRDAPAHIECGIAIPSLDSTEAFVSLLDESTSSEKCMVARYSSPSSTKD